MDSGLVWAGVCALSVVCVGVLLVGAFMVFKGGFGIFKDLYTSNFGEEDTGASSLDAPVLRRSMTNKRSMPSGRLGGRAQSTDPFDEALRRRRDAHATSNTLRAGVDTPRAGVDTPRAGAGTPRAGAGTPRAGVDTPRAGVSTPRAGVDTPRAGAGTPRAPLGGERRIPRSPANPRDWGARSTRRNDGQEIYDDEEGGLL